MGVQRHGGGLETGAQLPITLSWPFILPPLSLPLLGPLPLLLPPHLLLTFLLVVLVLLLLGLYTPPALSTCTPLPLPASPALVPSAPSLRGA